MSHSVELHDIGMTFGTTRAVGGVSPQVVLDLFGQFFAGRHLCCVKVALSGK